MKAKYDSNLDEVPIDIFDVECFLNKYADHKSEYIRRVWTLPRYAKVATWMMSGHKRTEIRKLIEHEYGIKISDGRASEVCRRALHRITWHKHRCKCVYHKWVRYCECITSEIRWSQPMTKASDDLEEA